MCHPPVYIHIHCVDTPLLTWKLNITPSGKGKHVKQTSKKLGFHVCLGVWSAIHQLSRLTASSKKKSQVASTHLPNHFAMDKPLRIHGTGMCVICISYFMVDFQGHFVGRYTRATYWLEGKFCPWFLVKCRHGMLGSLTTQLQGVAKCFCRSGFPEVRIPYKKRRKKISGSLL